MSKTIKSLNFNAWVQDIVKADDATYHVYLTEDRFDAEVFEEDRELRRVLDLLHSADPSDEYIVEDLPHEV